MTKNKSFIVNSIHIIQTKHECHYMYMNLSNIKTIKTQQTVPFNMERQNDIKFMIKC